MITFKNTIGMDENVVDCDLLSGTSGVPNVTLYTTSSLTDEDREVIFDGRIDEYNWLDLILDVKYLTVDNMLAALKEYFKDEIAIISE